jgi:hypothetical protein
MSGSSDAASINPAYAQHLETAEEKTFEFLSTALQNYPLSVKEDVISWVSLKLSSRKLLLACSRDEIASGIPSSSGYRPAKRTGNSGAREF